MQSNANKNTNNAWPRVALATAVWLLQPVAADAQSDTQTLNTVRECQTLSDDLARLACYDAVLPPGPQRGATVSAEPDQSGIEAAPVQPEQRRAEAAPSTREQPHPEAPPVEPERRRAQPAAATTDESTGRPRDSAAGPPPELLSIVDVRTIRAGGMARLYAADGRVFIQTSGRSRLNLPDPPFDGELESGALGSTFLRIPAIDRRIRVSLQE